MKKTTIIIVLFLISLRLFGQDYDQAVKVGMKQSIESLKNAVAYRQDFINKRHNDARMEEEYGYYSTENYQWGIRQKTYERDLHEVNLLLMRMIYIMEINYMANDKNYYDDMKRIVSDSIIEEIYESCKLTGVENLLEVCPL